MRANNSGNVAKRDLVLIHGWGFDSRIWQPFIPYIGDQWKVRLVNLPGYVGSEKQPVGSNKYMSIEQITDAIDQQTPKHATLLAWSLGGLIAMKLAARRVDISGLLLIACSPCFVNKKDWPHGIDPVDFNQLEDRLNSDKRKTLQGFAGLVAVGESQPRPTINKLSSYFSAAKNTVPGIKTLQTGLTLLKTEDLRDTLQSQRCPTVMLFGENDVLVKRSTGSAIKKIRADIKTAEISGAGHAPFFTRPQETAGALMNCARTLF